MHSNVLLRFLGISIFQHHLNLLSRFSNLLLYRTKKRKNRKTDTISSFFPISNEPARNLQTIPTVSPKENASRPRKPCNKIIVRFQFNKSTASVFAIHARSDCFRLRSISAILDSSNNETDTGTRPVKPHKCPPRSISSLLSFYF